MSLQNLKSQLKKKLSFQSLKNRILYLYYVHIYYKALVTFFNLSKEFNKEKYKIVALNQKALSNNNYEEGIDVPNFNFGTLQHLLEELWSDHSTVKILEAARTVYSNKLINEITLIELLHNKCSISAISNSYLTTRKLQTIYFHLYGFTPHTPYYLLTKTNLQRALTKTNCSLYWNDLSDTVLTHENFPESFVRNLIKTDDDSRLLAHTPDRFKNYMNSLDAVQRNLFNLYDVPEHLIDQRLFTIAIIFFCNTCKVDINYASTTMGHYSKIDFTNFQKYLDEGILSKYLSATYPIWETVWNNPNHYLVDSQKNKLYGYKTIDFSQYDPIFCLNLLKAYPELYRYMTFCNNTSLEEAITCLEKRAALLKIL